MTVCEPGTTSVDGMCVGRRRDVRLAAEGSAVVPAVGDSRGGRWRVSGAGEWLLEVTSEPPVRLVAMAESRRVASGPGPLAIRVCVGANEACADGAAVVPDGFDLHVVPLAADAERVSAVSLRWTRPAPAAAATTALR